MSKLAKFYNQNRHMVWVIILVIIAIIALIHILNNFAANTNNYYNNTTTNITNTDNKNYSVITENEVKSEVSKIIDEFINYCNNQETKKAYSLLSDECKKVLYPTLEDFIEKYYEKLFTSRITYSYQAWMSSKGKYTYKVDFVESMLATGMASNTSITDYYTVIENNGAYKLNINKFIGITNINKTKTQDNIVININRKRVYMDYEIYEIEVQNKLTQEIVLDTLEDTNTVYIEDDSGKRYYWYSHEILEEDITIRKAQGRKTEIKFNKQYKPKSEAKKIVFSKIMLDKSKRAKFEISL